ncbi:MAG TPA: hypothetical protein VFA32_07485 [Dehalococcoidia bacterium]|nr:hypothetical protein [Dehalococcoidia bacterium]
MGHQVDLQKAGTFSLPVGEGGDGDGCLEQAARLGGAEGTPLALGR